GPGSIEGNLNAEPVVETQLFGVDFSGGRHALKSGRQRNGRHRAEQIFWTGRLQIEPLAQEPPRIYGQRMIACAYFVPAAGQQISHPTNRFADTEPRGGVEGSAPVKTILKFRETGTRTIVAVTDRGRLQIRLFVFARP